MLKLKRKIKGILYKVGVHNFIPYKTFHFLAHLGFASAWISKNKVTAFNDFYTGSIEMDKRYDLYDFIIESEQIEAIDYLEFGVSKGLSFRKWVEKNQNPVSTFHGFDTFTGLPEAWGHFGVGAMSNGNKPPEIDDERVHFYQGLFQQTLIPFLYEFKGQNRKVIHLDADIYSATLYVLTLITPYLKSDDILIFDEFNVPLHEFKAFKEWSESFYIDYEVLGAVNNYFQIAIKIK